MAQCTPVPKVRLSRGLEICWILSRMWRVSGAHGHVDKTKAIKAVQAYVDSGLTTFDTADMYGPLRSKFSETDIPALPGLTKYLPRPGPMERKVVKKALRCSMTRMQVDSLDCVHFHWWDYTDKRYLDAPLVLTNFDTQRLEEITSRGIRISSEPGNTCTHTPPTHSWNPPSLLCPTVCMYDVHYSVIDQRPAVKMEHFCLANNIQLLTYGTLGEMQQFHSEDMLSFPCFA
uniref:NADP-dependent oxidoreductase domain-containing protein n=1 Tax=Mola mola TaxID=94237 RepID=A0A3Q3XMQ8_MOLML